MHTEMLWVYNKDRKGFFLNNNVSVLRTQTPTPALITSVQFTDSVNQKTFLSFFFTVFSSDKKFQA